MIFVNILLVRKNFVNVVLVRKNFVNVVLVRMTRLFPSLRERSAP